MKRVSVLMGGPSAEREVSLNSGANCAAALKEAGYKVATIDVTRDVPALIKAIKAQKPDVIFNALHGRWGEDGNIQGILNFIGIPYTHSGLMASAIAMDKPMAKRLFADVGLRCPKGVLLHKSQVLKGDPLPRPYVVKPANEGSSVGVQIIKQSDNARPFDGIEWPYGEYVLAEEFIQGREFTVGVMGDRAMTVTELKPDTGFYDYAHKYTSGLTVHLCPAPLREDIAAEAMRTALVAHQTLGCRGVTRCDFRYDDSNGDDINKLYLLEINTQPGMTALSLVPEQAKHLGISYPELVSWMVEHAACDA
ncbi:D-alanine--D-alanine ligase [Dongia deserti]|uniref:D-alanine--D-alanine ligase n=1 Tax=Dongia deserti TaxID=2268030 RepID=UPI000E64F1B1|nr:D-alanine--D-alanine ligase [Dongia deserti]